MNQHDPPTAVRGDAPDGKESPTTPMDKAVAASVEQRMQSDTPVAGAGTNTVDGSIPPSPSPSPTDEPAETAVTPVPATIPATAFTQDASSDTGSSAGPSPLLDLPQEIFDLMTTSLDRKDLRKLRDVSGECARKVRKVFAERTAGHRILLCDTKSLEIAAEASLDPEFRRAMLSSLIMDIAELKDWDAETALQENRIPITLTPGEGWPKYFPLVEVSDDQVSDDEDFQNSDDEEPKNSGDEEPKNSDDEESQNSGDKDSETSDDDEIDKRLAEKKDRKRDEIISSLRQTVPELNRLKRQQQKLREFNLDFHLLTAVFRNLRAYGELQSLEIAWPDFHMKYDDFGLLGLHQPDWDDTRPLRLIFRALSLSGLSPRVIKMPHAYWYPPPDIISQDQILLDHMRVVFNRVKSVSLTLGEGRIRRQDIRPLVQAIVQSTSLTSIKFKSSPVIVFRGNGYMSKGDAFMAELLTSTMPNLKHLSMLTSLILSRADFDGFIKRHSSSLEQIALASSDEFIDWWAVRTVAGPADDVRKILQIPDRIALCDSDHEFEF